MANKWAAAANAQIKAKSKDGLGDFSWDDDEFKQQGVILLAGDGGSGKTTFITRWSPGPIAFINFDGRAGRAVKEARKVHGKRILFTRIPFPGHITKLDTERAKKVGQEAVNRTIENLEIAVRLAQKGDIRTIGLDTGTEYSELIKIAVTGRIDPVKGDYGKSKDLVNREWWKLVNTVRECDAHLVILSRAQAIWESNEPTGEYKYRGPEVMNDAVDFTGVISVKAPKVLKKGRKIDPKFQIKITKAGTNIAELGQIYTQDDWGDMGPFVYSCLMNYPDSAPSDWE